MGKTTEIQWTDSTWNPWQGCKKVSEGCASCYMYRDKERYGQDPKTVVKSKPPTFNKPLKWKEPKLIFTCSWSDFFIEEADQWRKEAWEIIRNTPQHTYQILTKRPERIKEHLPADWGEGYKNVWMGISAENQERFDQRYPYLDEIKAKVKFISFEPLLGTIFFDGKVRFDLAIVGGESGNNVGRYKYRHVSMDDIEIIIQQCRLNDILVFLKQLGTSQAKRRNFKDRHGGDIDEILEKVPHLKEFGNLREFPKVV